MAQTDCKLIMQSSIPTPDISFHQGTWQFMAADLVEKLGTAHTLTQDLESVFWVLLWIVLKWVSSSWSDGQRASLLETMSSKWFKSVFLTSAKLDVEDETFTIPGNPFLCDLLKGVEVTVAERYHRQPTMGHDPHDPFGEVTQEVYDARMKAWHLGQEFLKDHSWSIRARS